MTFARYDVRRTMTFARYDVRRTSARLCSRGSVSSRDHH